MRHAYYAASTSRLETALLMVALVVAALVVSTVINRVGMRLVRMPARSPSPVSELPHVVAPLDWEPDWTFPTRTRPAA